VEEREGQKIIKKNEKTISYVCKTCAEEENGTQ
jgi:protein-arginine kinase activator protein McsA